MSKIKIMCVDKLTGEERSNETYDTDLLSLAIEGWIEENGGLEEGEQLIIEMA